MAKIPNPTLVSPRFNDVMLPQGAFGDSTRAIARLAQSVGGAADTVIKMGFEAQDLRNKTQTREKLRELREMHLSFQQEIVENNVDPAQWTPMWEAKLKGFEDSITNAKDMPQAVRDTVGEKFGDFSMESSFRIAGDALKENRQRAAKVYSYDVNESAKRGDWVGAEETIAQAEADGAIDPAEAEVARKSLGYAKTLSEREELLQNDPLEYKTQIEDPENPLGLTDHEKNEESKKAQVGVSQVARETLSGINKMVEAGMITSVDELKVQLEQYPEISDADKMIALKSFGEKTNVPLSYAERFEITDELTKNHQSFKRGELSAEEYTAKFNESMTKVEAYGSRNGVGGLKERAYKVDPSRFINPDGTVLTGEDLRAKMAKEKDVKRDVDTLIKDRLDGLTAVQLIDRFGVGAPVDNTEDRIKYEKAKTEQDEKNIRIRAAVTEEMDLWIDEQEEPPSFEDAKNHLNKIQAEVVFKTFRDSSSTPPRAQVVPEEVEKKLSNTPQQKKVPTPDARKMVLPEVEEYDKWINDPMVLPPLSR